MPTSSPQFPVVDGDGKQIGTMGDLILTEEGIEVVVYIPYGPETEKLFRDNVAYFSVGPYPIGPLTRAKNILDDVAPVQEVVRIQTLDQSVDFDIPIVPYLDHN